MTKDNKEYYKYHDPLGQAARQIDKADEAQNEVFRDPSLKQSEGWRVIFNGQVQSPVFNSPGAARAMLDALKSGARKPEIET